MCGTCPQTDKPTPGPFPAAGPSPAREAGPGKGAGPRGVSWLTARLSGGPGALHQLSSLSPAPHPILHDPGPGSRGGGPPILQAHFSPAPRGSSHRLPFPGSPGPGPQARLVSCLPLHCERLGQDVWLGLAPMSLNGATGYQWACRGPCPGQSPSRGACALLSTCPLLSWLQGPASPGRAFGAGHLPVTEPCVASRWRPSPRCGSALPSASCWSFHRGPLVPKLGPSQPLRGSVLAALQEVVAGGCPRSHPHSCRAGQEGCAWKDPSPPPAGTCPPARIPGRSQCCPCLRPSLCPYLAHRWTARPRACSPHPPAALGRMSLSTGLSELGSGRSPTDQCSGESCLGLPSGDTTGKLRGGPACPWGRPLTQTPWAHTRSHGRSRPGAGGAGPGPQPSQLASRPDPWRPPRPALSGPSRGRRRRGRLRSQEEAAGLSEPPSADTLRAV